MGHKWDVQANPPPPPHPPHPRRPGAHTHLPHPTPSHPTPRPGWAGLANLALLQELWLGRNRIAEVGDGLAALRSLKRLSLQSNRLTSMAGLQHCTALEELYLRH